VVLIEWADKIEPALRGTDPIRIDLAHAGQHKRIIRLQNVREYLKVL
jgi:tRNA A37 threonylcarbamoyladenosine biosynthesis protein TsaE